jgi:hypothetical protein
MSTHNCSQLKFCADERNKARFTNEWRGRVTVYSFTETPLVRENIKMPVLKKTVPFSYSCRN